MHAGKNLVIRHKKGKQFVRSKRRNFGQNLEFAIKAARQVYSVHKTEVVIQWESPKSDEAYRAYTIHKDGREEAALAV